MNERIPSFLERPGSGIGGPGGIFDQDDDSQVRVVAGFHDEFLPVAYSTVGEVRARLGDRLNLDPQSQAVLDGINVGDDIRIRPGQVLTFVRPGGEKGCVLSAASQNPGIDAGLSHCGTTGVRDVVRRLSSANS